MNTETLSYPPYAFRVATSTCWNWTIWLPLLLWKWVIWPLLKLCWKCIKTLLVGASEMIVNTVKRLESLILWSGLVGYVLVGLSIAAVVTLIFMTSFINHILSVVTAYFS